jgi:hypothetical protein
VTGIALIALGIACWPGRTAPCGTLTCSVLAMAFLTYLRICDKWAEPLVWPAVVLHGTVACFLANAWLLR